MRTAHVSIFYSISCTTTANSLSRWSYPLCGHSKLMLTWSQAISLTGVELWKEFSGRRLGRWLMDIGGIVDSWLFNDLHIYTASNKYIFSRTV